MPKGMVEAQSISDEAAYADYEFEFESKIEFCMSLFLIYQYMCIYLYSKKIARNKKNNTSKYLNFCLLNSKLSELEKKIQRKHFVHMCLPDQDSPSISLLFSLLFYK